MNEDIVIQSLKDNAVEFIASLPCDKNKGLTAMLPQCFHVISLAREEDGVGICAGLALAKKRAAVSIQSSGLGNMLNAIMSLTKVYNLPLPILASWRGVQNEAICAQIPFNKSIPELLDVYGIPYKIFSDANTLTELADFVNIAFERNTPVVALILPSCWGNEAQPVIEYPKRVVATRVLELSGVGEPELKRFEAISAVSKAVPDSAVIISNIGVPSKELYACGHRSGNFYMLGSYMQASAIALGCAIGCPEKEIYVLDGDGSILGSAILPVIATENPKNLHIIALDNGTFGSTGNQISPAYQTADVGMLALAAGISDVIRAKTTEDIMGAVKNKKKFTHVVIKPGNSAAKNLDLKPDEIKTEFMDFLQ